MEELIAQVVRRLAALPGLPTGNGCPPLPIPATTLASRIDHTLLKPEATPAQITALCAEAAHYNFASVCVNPTFVALCAQHLATTPVIVGTVIGFPLGATTTSVKCFEASEAISHGARELDMVLSLGHLKAGEVHAVAEDLAAVIAVGHAAMVRVKVIIETALLTTEEKITACLVAVRAGADFVKTSTGFAGGGATVADVALMRRVVGLTVGVKASGGVRELADALALLAAGADRLGTSAGVRLVQLAEGVTLSAPAVSSK